MNRMTRISRMENAKDKFAGIWKALNILSTECQNDDMEDDVLNEIRTARAIASAGEKIAAKCIREDNKALELEDELR